MTSPLIMRPSLNDREGVFVWGPRLDPRRHPAMTTPALLEDPWRR
jgi:hypothetical protein